MQGDTRADQQLTFSPRLDVSTVKKPHGVQAPWCRDRGKVWQWDGPQSHIIAALLGRRFLKGRDLKDAPFSN